MVEPGDRVLYVPEEAHALDLFPDGQFAWEFCQAQSRRLLGPREVVQLARDERGDLRDPAGRLVLPLRPRLFWLATVRAVHPDGAADLDIQAPEGCVTLHYNRRPHDPTKEPGTWHREEE